MAGKGRILVVDDDRLVLATLVHGLAQAGYEVIHADNGDDAILLAREHQPELALLDIRMEGKSGFDVAAYLREVLHIPFMFLSAFSDDATVQQVKALGAMAYLVKPLDIGQIVPTVEAAFGRLPARDVRPEMPRSATPAVPARAMPASEPGASTGGLSLVSVAVGVLMHRYSLTRGAALERLERQAESEQRAPAEQAERLLQAVELLSSSGS